MKDFIKWLGVNEKVGKVIVWLLIITIMLIITNTFLESVGLPYYRITVENLKEIKGKKILEYLTNWLVIILNFLSITLLVFKAKDFKKIFKYSILYLVLNIVINNLFGRGILYIYMITFLILFSYFFSHKNKKYVIYMIISLIANTMVQWVTYLYKVKMIDYTSITYTTKALLSLDYFIIMAIIILVKNIYLKKVGEKEWEKVGSGGAALKQKKHLHKN